MSYKHKAIGGKSVNKFHLSEISWVLTGVLAICVFPLFFFIGQTFLGWRATMYILAPIIIGLFAGCFLLANPGHMFRRGGRNQD